MRMEFEKYHGTGNDFIIIDDRKKLFNENDSDLINRLCRRRFGIGADGLILIRDHTDYDFEMVYFNADGKVGSMCGNGGRCVVAFANKKGIAGKNTSFLAYDGPHEAEVRDDNIVKLKMSEVTSFKDVENGYEMNTGSPHYVAFCDDVAAKDVNKEGKAIRNSSAYRREGINVNFVEQVNNGISIRTYERGVEEETYSCGTGVVASALSTALRKNLQGHNLTVEVKTLGGLLKVYFDRDGNSFRNIYLEGPAQYVFKGFVET